MDRRPFLRGVLACVAGLLLTAAAQAQAFRTYLSPAGVDNSACSLAAPCRLLPAALDAVANGGEVWMLDSANYNSGPVSVTKSVTILAVPGAVGSVVALGGNAINIATAGVNVALRNLVIVPYLGSSGSGINMTAGAALTIEDCLIANLSGNGIWVNAAATVRVTDTTIRNNSIHGLVIENGARASVTRATINGNGGVGIYVRGMTASTTTIADIADSTMNGNLNGISIWSNVASADVSVSVFASQVVANTYFGMLAQNDSGRVTLAASNNVISHNQHGIWAYFAGSKVWASGNTVSHNQDGFTNSGGLFESAGDNAVRNNTVQNIVGAIIVIGKS